MTTDFRTLLENLVEEVLDANQYKPPGVQRAIDRACAALAEPKPEEPTRRQLIMLADDMDMASVGDTAEYARAVLARWGRPAPQPVPVSERLPGPKDCDECGRCWWYGDGEDMVGWTFQDVEGLSYYKATYWLPAHALPQPS